ncbi:DNA repair protein RecN [uncultured Nevskia sp.]|uniref:DNA repair protein RecN n=1 Tax=uncultured Nevskia sp. TaxID=228950 RepID=UPI0025EA29DD|nr:DNA repair protein RecN [uncultured Nevskia sp.]
MLRSLHIRNLAIIDELSLDWSSGFTVLTGETGAGKSILIDALGLVIGLRADATLVRAGSERAEVSAEFSVNDCADAAAWLAERELLEAGSDDCAIRRIVHAEGRTRAFVNGSPVSATELRELGERLVEIFGQGDSRSLLLGDAQRQALDDAGRHAEPLAAVATAAQALQRIERDIEQLRSAQSRDPAQVEYLRFQLQELDALSLSVDELPELDAEHRRLANAGRLLDEGNGAQQLLYGDEVSVYDQLSRALSSLHGLVPLHEGFAEAETLTAGAQAQVREAADSLRRLIERLDLDPERLAIVENRLTAIHDLARKHRVRADELFARHAELQSELAVLEDAGAALGRLEVQRKTALASYTAAAATLTAARRKAAIVLAKAVTARVRELGMPNAKFVVAVEPLARDKPTSHGVDLVRFDFSANPGQPPRPLAKVASGGELSRISLALQVSLLSEAGAATQIFDEVDAGIGGVTADVVGRQLRALGARRQVLCVTHLAQVAARGLDHFGIAKSVRDGHTYTRVQRLDAPARVSELSRMLGGDGSSGSTVTLAKELLGQAATDA